MATDRRRNWKRDECVGESKVLVCIFNLALCLGGILIGPSVICRLIARLLTVRVHDQTHMACLAWPMYSISVFTFQYSSPPCLTTYEFHVRNGVPLSQLNCEVHAGSNGIWSGMSEGVGYSRPKHM
jgi:hypothetical protein